MCGLVGYFDPSGRTVTPAEVIASMLGTLVHRGPDSSGTFAEESVALAFRRLEINDPAGGGQPMFGEDEQTVVVCNGEVFNHRELRRTLEQQGHRFSSGSDVEVLLHGFESSGESVVKELDGQFSFAVYDRRQRRLVLGRDRVGITPLYYAVERGVVVFASEVKALLRHPLVRREVDPAGLSQFLSLPGLVSPMTMFEGVHSLPPGHLLVVDESGIRLVEYWDLDYPQAAEYEHARHDAPERALHDELLASVDQRMRSDVECAFYLSGGLDSSLVVGMATALGKARTRTFSVDFDVEDLSERFFQQLVARAAASRHTEVRVTAAEVGASLRRVVWHSEMPLKESYNAASMALSASVRSHGLKAVQSGEGADELFAGYIGYQYDRHRASRGRGRELTPREQHRQLLWGSPHLLYDKDFIDLVELKRSLFSDCMLARVSPFDVAAEQVVDPARLAGRDLVHQRSYLDFKIRLPEHLLGAHGDRMALANGVEVRYPFLGNSVLEAARTLAPDLKLNGFTGKHVLRRIARDYVDDRVIEREKFAFQAHDADLLMRAGSTVFDEYLHPARIAREGYFDPDTITVLRAQWADRAVERPAVMGTDHLMVALTFGMLLEAFDLPYLT